MTASKEVDDSAVKTEDPSTTAAEDSIEQDQDATSFAIDIMPVVGTGFKLQVNSSELVQELHQILMDREETCHFTCFSLHHEGVKMDNFAELKSIVGLKDGSVVKVHEEPYTVREARSHIRHTRDLLWPQDFSEAVNGDRGCSLSILDSLIDEFGIQLNNQKASPNGSSSLDDYTSALHPPSLTLGGVDALDISPLLPQSEMNFTSVNCLSRLSMSHWNPAPNYRKLKGDLLYINIKTVEGAELCVTATTCGFHTNRITAQQFDPRPTEQFKLYPTLIDLFLGVSSSFKRNYDSLQKQRSRKNILTRVPTSIQYYSWVAPSLPHHPDQIRSEDVWLYKLGYEEHVLGQTRDWNEELQSIREMPASNLTDRLNRDRALYKTYTDFVSSATRGAMSVVDGNVMPINPGECSKTHMFIYNNIFFSFGFDVKDHYKDLGGDNAAYVACRQDLKGVKAIDELEIEGLYTLGTLLVDYRGHRVACQTIMPGVLDKEQEESVVHGSVDFGKTVVTHDSYNDKLEKVARALKCKPHIMVSNNDPQNKKVDGSNKTGAVAGGEIAQQHLIHTSTECKGIIGNDNRHYVLDLLRMFPADINYLKNGLQEYKLSDFMLEKGFPRSHPHKLPQLRKELLESFLHFKYSTCADLLTSFLEHQANLEHEKLENANTESSIEDKKKDENSSESKKIPSIPTPKPIEFNLDAFSPGILGRTLEADKLNLENDRDTVRDAAQYMVEQAIPMFVRDCIGDNLPMPLDSEQLTEMLHARGINMRYLVDVLNVWCSTSEEEELHGKMEILDLTNGDAPESVQVRVCCPHPSAKVLKTGSLGRMVMSEMVCRSAKHVFKHFLQSVDEYCDHADAVILFLNCFFVSNLNSDKTPAAKNSNYGTFLKSGSITNKRGKNKNKKGNKSGDSGNQNSNGSAQQWYNLSPKLLWTNIKKDLQSYFQFDLNSWSSCGDVWSCLEIDPSTVLRTFCKKVGIQLVARDFNFPTNGNVSGADTKSKAGSNATTPTSPSGTNQSHQLFEASDLLNLYPVIKHALPRAREGMRLLTKGQTFIQQGLLQPGCALITEALHQFNHIYGPIHLDIAICLRILAHINYVLGDHCEAISHQHKSVLMYERCLGFDHPTTASEYMRLSLYCFANKQTQSALQLLQRARSIMCVGMGTTHPELSTVDMNIGLVLHSAEKFDLALGFLHNSLQLNIKYCGRMSLKTALSYHLKACVKSCQGDFRSALFEEKNAFAIYKTQLGEDSEKTRESNELLKHLTEQAVAMQRKINQFNKSAPHLAASALPGLFITQPTHKGVLEMLNVLHGFYFITLKKGTTSADIEDELKSVDAEEKSLGDLDQLKVPTAGSERTFNSGESPVSPQGGSIKAPSSSSDEAPPLMQCDIGID